MGWLADVLSNIPTLAVARERLELLRDKYQDLEAENDRLRELVENLKGENGELQQRAAVSSEEFVRYRGLLWLKESAGTFEPAPYCPKCRTPMSGVPLPASPFFWSCSQCRLRVDACSPPETQ